MMYKRILFVQSEYSRNSGDGINSEPNLIKREHDKLMQTQLKSSDFWSEIQLRVSNGR